MENELDVKGGSGHTAAFVRVEGMIINGGCLSAAAYFASNARGMRERALRLGQVALTAPVYHWLGQTDRTLANRLAYLPLRGMNEDRLGELAAEYAENILKPSVLQGGVELLRRARREGHRVVLISDSLSLVVEPLAEHLRVVDDIVCNQLEMRDGECTGRLIDPVVGGHDSGPWAKRYAAEHGIDLTRSVAYGAHGPDLLLMSAVGFPCAVNPDFTLRRAARDADWPVMDYRV
jgi:HAD superfamily phosphoserine phosphatase-like hydrolase